MRNNANRKPKRAGFTLIELLVVIAIVAALAAILFPVFSTVRERGRRTVCQSNLKQIALAMQQYVQDNGGVYPPLDGWEHAAYTYTKNGQVFHCPDYPVNQINGFLVLDPLSVTGPVHVDYDYNGMRLGVFLTPPTGKEVGVGGVRESAIATPSTIFLNRDAGWADADGALRNSRRVLTTSCGREFGGSTYHSGAGNYSYLDGHVQWLTPEEAGEVECANAPLPAPFKNLPFKNH
jgi:prepilin-type N-terminal cleavage/methylation domain-containing protein/prepilin-type processing-associated H-X9-DG protein